MPANFRYVALADEIQENILNGVFTPGEKLPSLRKLHYKLGMSISTVHQAYIELEKRGRVVAKEKSGFYVKTMDKGLLERPAIVTKISQPCRVTINQMAENIITDLQDREMIQFGAAIPARELMPLKQLSRIMKSIPTSDLQDFFSSYDLCVGYTKLREELARRMLGIACLSVTADDIVTTNGCLESVTFCLRAVADPGDTILVESPVFHCFLQLIEDLNLKVLEIPGCPEDGISPNLFEQSVRENNIKACLLNSNFQNPMGSVIPEAGKKKILAVAMEYQIPIIEDDLYGDLYHGDKRPCTFKSMDDKGMVLYCSSFSKSLSPGLRTGWTVPGKYIKDVIRLKLNTSISNPCINHMVTTKFIKTGAYDRHLRQLRNRLKNQISTMAFAVSKYFPSETKITFPKGGLFIWVELPSGINAMTIYEKAYQNKISLLPGNICSSSDRYRHCLRLNCGEIWRPEIESAIQMLGRIVADEM